MRRTPILVGGFVLLFAQAGQAFGWSLCDEIALLGANLSVQCVWEDTDAVTLCDSIPPPDLDRVACEIRDSDFACIAKVCVSLLHSTERNLRS